SAFADRFPGRAALGAGRAARRGRDVAGAAADRRPRSPRRARPWPPAARTAPALPWAYETSPPALSPRTDAPTGVGYPWNGEKLCHKGSTAASSRLRGSDARQSRHAGLFARPPLRWHGLPQGARPERGAIAAIADHR